MAPRSETDTKRNVGRGGVTKQASEREQNMPAKPSFPHFPSLGSTLHRDYSVQF